MRYDEIVNTDRDAGKTSMRRVMDAVRAVNAVQIWPEIGNPTADQQAAMPHVVDCHGLTVHDLGQVFAEEFQGRRLWCRKNCRSEFAVAPLRNGERDTGRRFSFADQTEAAMFRLTRG
jgi:hypothetical protein